MDQGSYMRRRDVLRAVGATGTIGATGCLSGDSDQGQNEETTTRQDVPGNAKIRAELALEYPDYELESELKILQWTNYWYANAVPDFEDAFGVSVTVTRYTSNEQLYEILSNEGFDAYDLLFPSDWMVTRLVQEDRLQSLDLAKIPNWENLEQQWVENAPYDLGEERYSAPYFWGTTGIAWHESMVDRPLAEIDHLNSWDAMWKERYSGQIQMMDLPRETYAAALKRLGYSLNTTHPDEIKEATELLVQQKELLARYKASQVSDDIINKRATPMHAFSGETLTAKLQLEGDDGSPVAYRIPAEGGVVWIDTMAIPREAPHPNAAHAFINYLLNERIGAFNANATFYATPNEAAKQNVEDELLSDPSIYPPADVQQKLEFIDDVGEARTHYDEGWKTVQSA